ncbi:MAG: phage holin family protein [Methylovulum sp.]|nr:MAG: phage holin family protein [Methylovulum sp.]
MNPNAADNETSGQTATRGDPQDGSGVLEDAQSLWRELYGLGHDHFRLAALETRRAGESLVTMIVAGVMVAVLLNAAWLGLVAAAVLGLIEHGVAASNAILLAVACNLLLALIFYGLIRHKSHYLQFPAFLRSLQPAPMHRDVERS